MLAAVLFVGSLTTVAPYSVRACFVGRHPFVTDLSSISAMMRIFIFKFYYKIDFFE